MNVFDINAELLAQLSLFVAVILFCAMIAVWRMQIQYKSHTQSKLEKLEAQLAMLSTGAQGMGKKLLDLEARLARLRESQSELQHSNVDFSYTQAQRLITEGLPNEAVAANSGLSASEINLMRLLSPQNRNLSDHV